MGSIDKACISGFLCRLCSEMHRIVIHIYGDQGQRLCLVEKINGYLPITISPTDPLPKTICTTCLRRVEQHYDLLMRLSRIKEERFLRVNDKRPRVSSISSIENSEDEVYQSDEESRRQYHQLETSPQTQNILQSTTSAPLLISAANASSLNTTSSVTSAHNDGNNEDIDAVTHGNSLAAESDMPSVSHNANINNDRNNVDLSSSTSPLSSEAGNMYVLQQHSN